MDGSFIMLTVSAEGSRKHRESWAHDVTIALVLVKLIYLAKRRMQLSPRSLETYCYGGRLI